MRSCCRSEFTSLSLLLATLLTLGVGAALQAQEEQWHGYIGVDFDDSSCRAQKLEEREAVVWFCSVPIVLNKVYEVGPAYSAGMRAGDVILAVNGHLITTIEGGRQFGNMRLGVPVTFHLRRDGQEIVLTVTPATKEEAFPDSVWDKVEAEPMPDRLRIDSLSIQMKEIYEGHVRLSYALKNAERALAMRERQLEREPSAEQRRQVMELRAQIDSIEERLLLSHVQIRVHLDSLAREMWVELPTATVEPAPAVSVEVPRRDPRSVTIYPDAVAGARFQALDEQSELIDYFPGVEQGLLITQVVVDTPAHLAGLRAGDVVIEVNGEPIATVSELRRLMHGDVQLTYVRRGRKHTCTIPSR